MKDEDRGSGISIKTGTKSLSIRDIRARIPWKEQGSVEKYWIRDTDPRSALDPACGLSRW